MEATGAEHSLVKLNAEEVSEIKQALSCGLSGGYPEDSRVYYTGGDWHGYKGNLQSGVSYPYIVCTAHTAETYEQYLQSQVPDPSEPAEPGEGSTGHTGHNHG